MGPSPVGLHAQEGLAFHLDERFPRLETQQARIASPATESGRHLIVGQKALGQRGSVIMDPVAHDLSNDQGFGLFELRACVARLVAWLRGSGLGCGLEAADDEAVRFEIVEAFRD